MKNDLFKYQSPNFDKLKQFGFLQEEKNYFYATKLGENQFEMRIFISAITGEVKTEIIDLNTNEPYTLHLVSGACGSFVGNIRNEYNKVLTKIIESCFEKDVFQGNIAHEVIQYVQKKYGDELQFLWSNSPTNAVWRRKDNKKWYGVLLILSKKKLGLDSDDLVQIIDLRLNPEHLPHLIDRKKYFPGYHMNKRNWFTMCLDGSVSVEEICSWIDKSFTIAGKK